MNKQLINMFVRIFFKNFYDCDEQAINILVKTVA